MKDADRENMDSANRDEAVRCLEFARGALRKGDVAKAKRLAEKSLRLCHTKEGAGEATGSSLAFRIHSPPCRVVAQYLWF